MKEEFVQVLHSGRNHWITVATIGCPPSSIRVYDSFNTELPFQTKEQICAILHSYKPFIDVEHINVQDQINAFDCVVFSLAFVTALCAGQNPEILFFTRKLLHPHLLKRLENEDISPFPCTTSVRVQVRRTSRIEIFCQCRTIASNPNSANSYYNLASALHKNGKLTNRQEDFLQAEQLYNQCLEYDANHAECYRGLAVLLTETDRQDAAFRLLEGWASRSPQLANPRIEIARLLEETNNLPQAQTRLVEALTIDPHNSRALTALGRLREVSGDPAQALANYQRSLQINRFQPAIEARVASLRAVTAAPIIMTPINGTRTVQQWQPNVRY